MMAMIIPIRCDSCGKESPEAFTFCPTCGAFLKSSYEDEAFDRRIQRSIAEWIKGQFSTVKLLGSVIVLALTVTGVSWFWKDTIKTLAQGEVHDEVEGQLTQLKESIKNQTTLVQQGSGEAEVSALKAVGRNEEATSSLNKEIAKAEDTEVELKNDNAAVTALQERIDDQKHNLASQENDLQKDRNTVADLQSQLSSVLSILTENQDGDAIMTKLQQDFSTIKDLKIRLTFIYDKNFRPVSLTDYFWELRLLHFKGDGFIQFTPLEKEVLMEEPDQFKVIRDYAPDSSSLMKIYNEPIGSLKGIDCFSLTFPYTKSRFFQTESTANQNVFQQIATSCNADVNHLTSIRCDLYLNGYGFYYRSITRDHLKGWSDVSMTHSYKDDSDFGMIAGFDGSFADPFELFKQFFTRKTQISVSP